MPDRTGPTQGVQPKAKAAPKKKEPIKVDAGWVLKVTPEKPLPNTVMMPKVVTATPPTVVSENM